MSVVYILEKFPNLTETFILNEIKSLQNNGVRIRILAVNKGKYFSEFTKDFEGIKVNYFSGYLSLRHLRSHFYLIKSVKGKYFRVLKEILFNPKFTLFEIFSELKAFSIAGTFLLKVKNSEITLIHGHFISFPTSIALYLSQFSGIPFSCSAHAHDIYKGNTSDIIHKIKKSKFTVTCTLANKTFLSNLCPFEFRHKIFHIYHGIDIEEWSSRSYPVDISNEFHLLCVARLVEKKGIQYLLLGLEILINKGVHVKCSIIGEGPLNYSLKKIVSEKKLDRYVTFYGALSPSGVKEIFKTIDCFVLPCIIADDGDRDGLPNVLLEAMSLGVPVVTTSVSAITELIKNEITGILVEEHNPFSIANAVLELINNPKLRQNLVKNGRNVIEKKFSLRESTTKLKKLILDNKL